MVYSLSYQTLDNNKDGVKSGCSDHKLTSKLWHTAKLADQQEICATQTLNIWGLSSLMVKLPNRALLS